ncbi:MFS transporter [Pseudonocardia endophytica]|uniref:EmrB/QacA subfamily drug resistance transporter n=1 Tax=Pseudonocardia endophytica TaxID=401976 RepID=A0A4R1HYE4_PSEEN|nr:MFS transporter [Pseudonocardia endophytica]TCK22592.1 EmrB/QacA subfamily drug resistance transporter [Pseudonocardia endophytica]
MPSSTRRWWILVVIGIAQLMVILDNTIVNIALPSAQLDLAFSDAQRQWIVTAYALSFGSLLLLGGRMSDVFGRRGAFLTGLVGFAVVSVLGGLAPNVGVLIAARALQGVFGALLAPAALSLLTTTFPGGRDRAVAFGVFSAVAGSGAATGLLLGGALTQFVDWRWCMYVNAVFAAVAIVGAVVLLDRHVPGTRPHLDLVGTVLAAAGLFCLVFGLGIAESDGWSSPVVLVTLPVGVVLLGVFVATQRRIRSPLLPLRVVLDRNRGGAFLTILALTLGMFSLSLFLTFVLQRNLGFSPLLSGVAFLPMVASIVTTSTTMPSTLLPRVGPKPLIVAGLLLGSGALFWLSRMEPGVTYAGGILGPLILMGLGMGTAMSTSINTATLGVEPSDAGVASASVNTMQQVGGSVGTALLSSVAGTAGAAFAATGAASPQDAALHGYGVAFAVSSAVFLGMAVIAGLIVPFGRPHRARGEEEAAAPAADTVEEPASAAPAPALVPAIVGQVHGAESASVLTLIDVTGRQVDRATAGDDGRYRLVAPSPGTYTVIVGADGYHPVAERLSLTAEVAHELAVRMRPAVPA